MATTEPLAIRCKTCDVGTMQRKHVHRMSAIVVLIGYVILVPTVLVMVASVMTIFNIGSAAPPTAAVSAIATGFSVMLFFVALVGGLLGWVLIMKKRILQCDRCGAVVAAS